MGVTHHVQVSTVGELLGRELPNGLQHRESGGLAVIGASEQAVVNQLGQRVENRAAEVGRRTHVAEDGEVDAAAEHRADREQPLRRLAQKLVAPRDRGTQRSLTVGDVSVVAHQERQRVVEPLEDRLRRQHPDPRRSQLDRERQAVEPFGDPANRVDVPVGDREARDRGGSTVREELDGLRQGRHWHLLLPCEVQRCAACHQDVHGVGGSEESGHEAAGLEHLLHVVEDQQDLPPRQVRHQVVQERRPTGILQAESARYQDRNERRVPDRREVYEDRAVCELRLRPSRQLSREPSLARAPRPGEREQPGASQQASRLGQLILSADEARRRLRQHDSSLHHCRSHGERPRTDVNRCPLMVQKRPELVGTSRVARGLDLHPALDPVAADRRTRACARVAARRGRSCRVRGGSTAVEPDVGSASRGAICGRGVLVVTD